MNNDLTCPQCNKEFKTKGGRNNHVKNKICQKKDEPKNDFDPDMEELRERQRRRREMLQRQRMEEQQDHPRFPEMQQNIRLDDDDDADSNLRDKHVPYEKTDEETSINLMELNSYQLRLIILKQQCSIRKLQAIIAQLRLEVQTRSRESYAYLQNSILELFKDPELVRQIVFGDDDDDEEKKEGENPNQENKVQEINAES